MQPADTMTYMRKPTPRRPPGRPVTEAVRLDCLRIGDLIAEGYSEVEIRCELKLSRRAFDDRMRRLGKTTVNRTLLWAKFLAAQRAEIGVLSELAEAALAADPPQLNAAISAIVARSKMRAGILDMGRRLGVYGAPSSRQVDARANLTETFPAEDNPELEVDAMALVRDWESRCAASESRGGDAAKPA